MATLKETLGRVRILATQMGVDANQSVVIDNLSGARALLNHVIRDVYRRKANDKKNYHDITERHTVNIAASSGTVPTRVMREFLPQANFEDSLGTKTIAYVPYSIDYDSGVNFTQIGYVTIRGNNFRYMAPTPNQNFTGTLYVTVQSMPVIPDDWDDELSIDSDVLDDIIIASALALRGEYSFDGVGNPPDDGQ